jgi:hypothetical protein
MMWRVSRAIASAVLPSSRQLPKLARSRLAFGFLMVVPSGQWLRVILYNSSRVEMLWLDFHLDPNLYALVGLRKTESSFLCSRTGSNNCEKHTRIVVELSKGEPSRSFTRTYSVIIHSWSNSLPVSRFVQVFTLEPRSYKKESDSFEGTRPMTLQMFEQKCTLRDWYWEPRISLSLRYKSIYR